MLIDRDIPNFQPSSSILSAMTFVRRRPIGNSVEVWGLFDEHKVGVDQALFWVALMLEIFGIYMITKYMPTNMAIGLVVLTVFVDLLLAFFHHRYSCKRILHVRKYIGALHSQISGQPNLTNKYEQSIAQRNAVGNFFSVLLVVVTVLKIGAFYIVNGRHINTLLLGMAALYIAICLIHLFVSGYAMSYIRASGWFGLWGFGAEAKSYNNNPIDPEFIAQDKFQVLVGGQCYEEILKKCKQENPDQSHLIPDTEYIKVREHKILATSDGIALELLAHGIIYNDDIRELMRCFRNMASIQEVALAALHIQAHQIITDES